MAVGRSSSSNSSKSERRGGVRSCAALLAFVRACAVPLAGHPQVKTSSSVFSLAEPVLWLRPLGEPQHSKNMAFQTQSRFKAQVDVTQWTHAMQH